MAALLLVTISGTLSLTLHQPPAIFRTEKTRQSQAGGSFLSLNASREIQHLTIRRVTSPAVGLRGNRLSSGNGRCVLVRGWLSQAGEMKEQGQEERCHKSDMRWFGRRRYPLLCGKIMKLLGFP